MLSPGKDYLRIPKDRVENLRFRKFVLDRADQNPRYRAALRETCKHDLLFYLGAFGWTYDPRTAWKSLPFITWPFQDRALLEILDCVESGRDLVIEKSRDMGASWMSLVAMEWLWHFHPGFTFLMVSRKEDLVDAPGDPDSLFWKLDFVHRLLPDWLRPRTDRRKLHFGNLDNGSTIDGESTTAAAGVGGRRSAMFIDEFSRIEEGYQLLAGTADTTRCRIFNFTPFGTSNAAYRLARRGDVRKLRLHWSEHPEKARGLYRYSADLKRVEVLDKGYFHGPDFDFVMDGKLRSPWYDAECRRRANDREVAQMLDIDYQGSAYQYFDQTLIHDLRQTYCVDPYWEGDVAVDPDTGRPRELVKSKGGPLKLWTLLHDGRPLPGSYAAGSDVAVGTGATPSCWSCLDCRTGEKVAEYASPFVRPEAFAVTAVALCWLFGDGQGEGAAFAWEMQGPGVVFGKKVVELGYRNVYYRTNERSLGMKVSDQPGWYPSPDNRRVLLEEYRSALASRSFVNRSVAALEECLDFVHTARGTVEHAGGADTYDPSGGDPDPTGAGVNHGDRVIADALAWKMCQAQPRAAREPEKVGPAPGSLAWRRELAAGVYRKREAWV